MSRGHLLGAYHLQLCAIAASVPPTHTRLGPHVRGRSSASAHCSHLSAASLLAPFRVVPSPLFESRRAAALEIAKVVAGLPPSRSIISGYYATGHSSSGQPTARYVSRLLQTLAAQDRVSGVMTYCAKAALHACDAPPLFDEGTGAGDRLQHQLGCIVRRAYRAIAGVRTEV